MNGNSSSSKCVYEIRHIVYNIVRLLSYVVKRARKLREMQHRMILSLCWRHLDAIVIYFCVGLCSNNA